MELIDSNEVSNRRPAKAATSGTGASYPVNVNCNEAESKKMEAILELKKNASFTFSEYSLCS